MTATFHDISAMPNPPQPPLVPENLPLTIYIGGIEGIVERVALDNLIDGSWQRERGVEFLRTANLGQYGIAAVYWPKQEEDQT